MTNAYAKNHVKLHITSSSAVESGRSGRSACHAVSGLWPPPGESNRWTDTGVNGLNWIFAAVTAVFAAIVGVVLVGVGCWSAYRAVRRTFWWPKASARIVRYWITRSEDKPDGQKFFHPVVKFDTADGRVAVAISSWGSWRRPWPVGHAVSVHYNPTNPARAEIHCFANMWGPLLTCVALLVFSLVLLGLFKWIAECAMCP